MSRERAWLLLQEHCARRRDLSARHLSQAEQALRRSQHMLGILHQYIADQGERARQAQAEGIPWSPVRGGLQGRFRAQLDATVQQQEQRVDLGRQGVEHQRSALLARQQRLKAVEWISAQRLQREQQRATRRADSEHDDWLQARRPGSETDRDDGPPPSGDARP